MCNDEVFGVFWRGIYQDRNLLDSCRRSMVSGLYHLSATAQLLQGLMAPSLIHQNIEVTNVGNNRSSTSILTEQSLLPEVATAFE